MYVFQAFPKWKYHADQGARVVESKEAEEALGAGWVDSPADLPTVKAQSSDVVAKIEEILEMPKAKSRKAKA